MIRRIVTCVDSPASARLFTRYTLVAHVVTSLSLLVLFGTCGLASAQSKVIEFSATTNSQSKVMSVDDVIKLSKAGITDDVIIVQIKKRPQPFELSTDQLIQLKSAHVSDRVIEAMTDSHLDHDKTPESTGQKAAGRNSAGTGLQPPTISAAIGQGPFGFQKGMTRQQVIQLVGSGAIKPRDSDSPPELMVLTTAPKPHSAYHDYALYFSPTMGLLKVAAQGDIMHSDDYGIEIQRAFEETVKGVSSRYGPPTSTFNNCTGDDFYCKEQNWTYALYRKNRTLSSYWMPDEGYKQIGEVTTINVEAVPVSTNGAFISVAFEFSGWHEYVEARKAKANSAY